MAFSSMKIPTENITKAKSSVARTGQKTGNSFASVMAREQQADKSVKAQVARLPESQGLPLRSNNLAGRTPSDMMRMQAFNQARSDLTQTRTIDGLMQNFAGSGSTLDLARGLGAARSLRLLAANNNGRGFALAGSDYIHTTGKTGRVAKSTSRQAASREGVGLLSAQFESGRDGIAAIGYDSTGGTSYGKYQIASKVGSMKSFLNFLDGEAPDLAKRLRKAGPANTGSRKGGMPNEWRAIANEQPERFEKLQEAFIHQSHYQPALEAIERSTGIDASSLSPAMREVIWSTAVQHGPAGAARIFARADDMSGKASDASYERKMITNVYNVRATQFGSSSRQVQEAVKNRFRQEKQLALNMLDNSRSSRA